MGTLVLVCAVMAAMAAGVLLAYGVCHALFSVFRMHASKIAPLPEPSPIGKPQIAEV